MRVGFPAIKVVENRDILIDSLFDNRPLDSYEFHAQVDQLWRCTHIQLPAKLLYYFFRSIIFKFIFLLLTLLPSFTLTLLLKPEAAGAYDNKGFCRG